MQSKHPVLPEDREEVVDISTGNAVVYSVVCSAPLGLTAPTLKGWRDFKRLKLNMRGCVAVYWL